MGIFDDVLGGSRSSPLSKQEAFLGILMTANASDGHVSDEEVAGLITITARMKLFEGWDEHKWRKAFDRLAGMMRRSETIDQMISTCVKALPEQLSQTVFANAVDLVLADGVVEDEEREFINKLWKALGISGDEAKTIVQIMVIKNRG
jgi:tellurite resistance protein